MLRRMLKKFRKAEDGNSTVEFVFLFPLFITIMSMSIEVAIYMARHVMLDRGVDIAVRELMPDRDLKLGVLMALVGAPLFLHLIYKTRKEMA